MYQILAILLVSILLVSVEGQGDAASRAERQKKRKEDFQKFCAGDEEIGKKSFKTFTCFSSGVRKWFNV